MDDNYNDVLNTYYKFKAKYEEGYNLAKNKIRKKKISNEAKNEMIRNIKRKCVNCDAEGGMLFTNEGRILKGICNAKNPCKFNIELNIENCIDNKLDLEAERDNLEEKMSEIIVRKLHLLFELEAEEVTIDEFNKLKPEYIEIKALIDEIEEDLDNKKKMRDPETNDLVYRSEMYKQINTQLANNITDFKDNLKKSYLTEVQNQKKAFLKDAMDIYVTKILNDQKFLRDIKYKYCAIEKTPVEIVDKISGQTVTKDFNILVQKEFLQQDNNYNEQEGGVVSNIYDVAI